MTLSSGKSNRFRRRFAAVLFGTVLLAGQIPAAGWAAPAASSGAGAIQASSEEPGISADQAGAGAAFKDIQGTWASRQVGKWAGLGLVNGSGGQFRPGDTVSRAEFAKLVNALFGFTAKTGGTLGDVAPGKWYAEQVAIALQAGYMEGYPGGLFKPEAAVTRQEAAKIAALLFPLATADSAAVLSGFKDRTAIGGFAVQPLADLVSAGALKGFADGTLRPQQPLTRAEAVVLLDRLAGEIIRQPGSYDGVKSDSGLLIASADTILKQAEVKGNVLITAGVGEGEVTLDGLSADGTLYVNGGGSHSVHLRNAKVGKVVVNKSGGPVRVVLEGSSKVGEMSLETGAVVEVGEQAEVASLQVEQSAGGTELNVKGTVGELQTQASGVTLNGETFEQGKVLEVQQGKAADKTEPQNGNAPAGGTSGGGAASPGNGGGSGGGGNGGGGTAGENLAAPVLTPDPVNNVLGRDVALTFADNPAWRNAISEITLNGRKLTLTADYLLSAGSLTLKASVFAETGDHTLIIKAAGYTDVSVTQPMGKWELVWGDEFDGSGTHVDANGVNLDKWGYQNGTGAEYGLDGWGNNEQQYYTKDNLKVQDGKLTITAKKQPLGGKPYTSGRLWTSPTFTKQYGRFEASIKLPEGEGLWPAFWMMPKDSKYGVWASSGELDIMEVRGRLPEESSGTIHYGKPWPNNKSTGTDYHFPAGQSISSGFHTYAVEWEPGEIRWYVDGNLFQKVDEWSSEGAGQPDKYAFPAPFDQPFYIILNLAVGGNFDGNRLPPDSKLPAEMQVDYVRAYELDGKPYKTPVEPVLAKEPIPAEARQPVDGSYIADSNFEQGLTDIPVSSQPLSADKWNFLHTPDYGGAGSASIEQIENRNFAKIVPTSAGNQNYSLQMIQYAPLVRGHVYKLSFDAKSDAERSIAVKMGGDGDNGWAAYSDNFDVKLQASLQHYEYRFVMGAQTDLTARLEFNAGLNTHPVWIGHVRLEETDQVTDPDGAKTPLEDGNHIYNGTFDLGTMDRMKYWHFVTEAPDGGADASASVDPDARELAVDIRSGGSHPQAVRLLQKGINLLQNDTYELTFEAKAGSPRSIGVTLLSKDGSTIYGKAEGLAVGTTAEQQTVTFTMPVQVSDPEGQLVFELGGGQAGKAALTLDNIRLIRTTNNNVDYSKVSLYPLVNGDFSAGLSGWEPFTQGAAANFSAADGIAKVSVSNVGTEAWNIMFNQSNLNLTKGFTYVLAFDAKSSAARDTEVTLEDAAYNRRFDSGFISLGTDWQHYEYTVKAAADDNVALKLLLGKTPQAPNGAHDVSFRNVVLEVKDAPLQRPPALAADATDNRYGQPVQIGFKDNEAWRTAISSILVNDRVLEAGAYEIQPGALILLAPSFSSEGTYRITVKAAGYADTSVTQVLIAGDGNLLVNGGFDQEKTAWELWVANEGDTTFDVKDGAAELNIHYYGGLDPQWGVPFSWYTQLMQSGVKVEAGKTYELSFRAWSSVDRPILVELTGYNNNQQLPFSITGDSQEVYTAVLKPSANAVFTLKYLLGNVITDGLTTPDAEHQLHLDDIKLTEVKGGPQLTADTTENQAGHEIELTFPDDPDWRGAISGVLINGTAAGMDKVAAGPGSLKLEASLFPSPGSYTISILAQGYAGNTVSQLILSASPNVALGKTATASTSVQSASGAVDGNANTRWESDFNDPQWLSVDLGGLYRIDSVLLNWEGAYGKTYQVQISQAEQPGENDWTDWYTEAAGNGGQDLVFAAPAEARHVRILGTARATQYGYSLWEMEVYGTPAEDQTAAGEDVNP
uniref:Endo-beta-1,3-glucanase n=1 Tax=Paenibacillus sp. CCRC 17245 TaxID=406252 RepID=Q000P7_9BACL|nr:endo-beta-1,3-glucanase [Paenibacillus sp. CCRC 17245]